MFQRFAKSEHTFGWKNAKRSRKIPRPMISLPAELQISPPPPIATGSRSAAKKKPRCEDCFFHQNRLCALQDKKPCPTFRLAHPDGLRPPQQLSFVFRQERRAEPFVFRPATL
jgi:hypothetical protein